MFSQIQKVQNEVEAEGLDLAPLARLIELVVLRWKRAQARKSVRALADALALICDRVEREPARLAALTGKRQARKLERVRIRQLRDGEDAAPLSAGEVKVLAKADAIEASAALVQPVKGKPATKARSEARRMRSRIGRDLDARTQAKRDALRLDQTLALDAAREGIEPDQAHTVLEAKRGQKRLKTRDGLIMLRESGAFTPRNADGSVRHDMAARIEADRLLAIGLRYRDRYEMAQASLRSCLAVADNPPPSANLYVQAKASQRRAALANQVRVLDIAVATRLNPDALLALRMVAGEARTINSITTARRRRGRLAAGLAAALAIVGDVLAKPLDGRTN